MTTPASSQQAAPSGRTLGPFTILQPTPPAPPDKAAGLRRAVEVGVRSLHLVSMGLVLGGILMGGTWATLRGPIVATLATGGLLLFTTMRWGCLDLAHGAGWAVMLKLALLGLGNLFEGVRLECYALATIVASVGSHMPSAWRHYTFPWLARREAEREAG